MGKACGCVTAVYFARETVATTAAMIAFMVSDENSFTTGATFDLSGGRTTY